MEEPTSKTRPGGEVQGGSGEVSMGLTHQSVPLCCLLSLSIPHILQPI